ncbi:MAG TPA: helix-turn-helix domain-containing protein [Acidimicrobiales bacterium]|nr:helix-turn-helix domain-containing protein [Acidimicrobiales bacterium]
MSGIAAEATTTHVGEGPIDPIFTSVKSAARALGLSPWVVYQLLDAGEIEGRYHGRRRLVVVESLREYARKLPAERPSSEDG